MKELTIGNLIFASILLFLSGYIYGIGQNLTNSGNCGKVTERINYEEINKYITP